MQILDRIRDVVRSLMIQEAKLIHKASGGRVNANHITWLSVFLHFPIAYAIIQQLYVAAGLMLIVFGLLDAVDGALARLQNKASNYGVFLDSTTDRIKESLVYMPLVYVFASEGLAYEAVLTAAALSGALITSYVRARGESVLKHTKKTASETNQIFKGGLARLEIRMAAMAFGLLAGEPYYAVLFIAVTAWATIFYRMNLVMQALK